MKLKLKEIAAISGKPGLFKIVKPTRTGVIVESLDEKKTKLSVGAAHRVSILKEVSIYTNDQEGAIALEEVLHRIYEEYQGALPFDSKSEKDELTEFMEKILPDYDRDKVYVSDMKKLVSWYNVIHQYSPLTLQYMLREDELDQIPDPDPEEVVEETPLVSTENPRLRTKSKRPKSEKKAKKAAEEQEKKQKAAAGSSTPVETIEISSEVPQEELVTIETEPEIQEEIKTPTKGKTKNHKIAVQEEPDKLVKTTAKNKAQEVDETEEESEEDLDDVLMGFASELEQKFKVKRGSKKKRRKK